MKNEKIIFDSPTIVLGSASKLRAKILRQNGFEFETILKPIDEDSLNTNIKHHGVSKKFARDYVLMLAREKQAPFIDNIVNGAVITADTVAWCDRVILEKPLTREKCEEQHHFISGKYNYAITGHGVYYNGKTAFMAKVSKVWIEPLHKKTIQEICDEPDTLGAAGYRIGGEITSYISWGKGHCANIRGLDVGVVRKLLKKVGYPL